MPARWWVVAVVGVGIGALEIAGGFDWRVGAIVFGALAAPAVAVLVAMSRTVVTVDLAGLHAGGRTLPLPEVADAVVLDPVETRHRLGPGADPAAHLVTRGFVRTAVLVRPVHPSPAPYWLVSSRRPDELVASLGRSVSS